MSGERCAKQVTRDWHTTRCQRKAGYGPDGTLCRQHAERDFDAPPIAVWYKTNNRFGFEIEAVDVFQVSDKTILIRAPFASRDVKERVAHVTQMYSYWPTWEEAVEHLRKRLDSQRQSLVKAEAEFLRGTAARPKPQPFTPPPSRIRTE